MGVCDTIIRRAFPETKIVHLKKCSKNAGISLTFHLCINANEKVGLSKICLLDDLNAVSANIREEVKKREWF